MLQGISQSSIPSVASSIRVNCWVLVPFWSGWYKSLLKTGHSENRTERGHSTASRRPGTTAHNVPQEEGKNQEQNKWQSYCHNRGYLMWTLSWPDVVVSGELSADTISGQQMLPLRHKYQGSHFMPLAGGCVPQIWTQASGFVLSGPKSRALHSGALLPGFPFIARGMLVLSISHRSSLLLIQKLHFLFQSNYHEWAVPQEKHSEDGML